MKLNADILYEALADWTSVCRMNHEKETAELERPVFYKGGEMLRSCVYIAEEKQLPPHPPRETKGLLLLVGEDVAPVWRNGNCAVFRLDASCDILCLFNFVQGIFDRYDQWDEKMRAILEDDADIGRLLSTSQEIFDNQITVVDDTKGAHPFQSEQSFGRG